MKSIEGLKLINRIHKDLINSGFNAEKLVADLKKLRPYSIEDEDPVMAKVIRLTYEHIEQFDGFFITIPEDISVEDEEIIESDVDITESIEAQMESLEYLFSLIQDSTNKNNRMDLIEYRSKLVKFAEENA
jgi:hypothetical protein